MGNYASHFQRLCKIKMRRLVFVMGIMASMVLVMQTVTFPYRNDLSPFYHASKIPILGKRSFPSKATSPKSLRHGNLSLVSDSQNSSSSSIVLKEAETAEVSNEGGETNRGFRIKEILRNTEKDDDSYDDIDLHEGRDINGRITFDLVGDISNKVRDPLGEFFTARKVVGSKNINITSLENIGGQSYGPYGSTFVSDGVSKADPISVIDQIKLLGNESAPLQLPSVPVVSNDPPMAMTSIISSSRKDIKETVASSGHREKETLIINEALIPVEVGPATSNLNSSSISIPLLKITQIKPPLYISNISHLLIKSHASNNSMRPQWSLACDKQISAAKEQIENAPIVKNDRKLYAPLFQNISMFKRSYELMERTLKIYVYKEGQKPIFHQPLLKGIYASEGWFMKLMEMNRHFVVKDPRKAHLFYMPFSSRSLRFSVYTRELRNRRDLEQYMKNYVDLIAAKYPFWNRTGGADHFLVACHDWAPFETRYTMKRSIRALCTADQRRGFLLGKDVSLPQANVRSPENPLKGLGGKPANRRHIFAFFAGNMHGSLRPVLLRHWENKDPELIISGLLPVGLESKMSYVQYMKTSKYCICPRGHEANSPRVAESIFYECVPVIISDNYVLPFSEVLNWEAFSVILREKDVPRLKELLKAIPEEKYRALQKGVRKVQQYFLWHSKPVKYDLFHMILHSIWFSRLYQIGTR